MEKGRPFLNKFGFRMSIGENTQLKQNFGTDMDMRKVLMKHMRTMWGTTIKHYKVIYNKLLSMIFCIVDNQGYSESQIKIYDDFRPYWKTNNSHTLKDELLRKVEDINIYFEITKSALDNQSLTSFLILLVKDERYDDYNDICRIIFDNIHMCYSYKDKKINIKNVAAFQEIQLILNNATFIKEL